MTLGSDVAYQRAGVLLLRFTVAGLMLFHGIAKIHAGVSGIESMVTGIGLPPWFAYGVLIGEVIAPILVIVGVLVRPAALIMAVNMIVAVALAHPADLLALSRTGGYALELQAFFFLCSIAVALLVDPPPEAARRRARASAL